MTLSKRSIVDAASRAHTRLGREFFICFVACAFSTSLLAQSATPPADSANADGRARRGNFNPADFQGRMMASLRDQLAVKDDAEWSLVAERITAVLDLRRSLAAGGFRVTGGSTGNRTNRPGAMVNPEQDALRAALDDNLPDAEITARLARLREVRKQNEEKLDHAHEELRAVLTVRQEAVAVTAGLLN